MSTIHGPGEAEGKDRDGETEQSAGRSRGAGTEELCRPAISIVMPCLNEEEGIAAAIENAQAALVKYGLPGEIIICDNGSTDRSVEIAESCGVHVVHERTRGYGSAYMRGIREARGAYVVMADADGTYDLKEMGLFINKLDEGYDVVMGNRFKGNFCPEAMAWSHRYIGNPLLSGILNLFFHTGVGDAHSGMRAFRRDAYERMHLNTTGMEFASEMVINASKAGLKITEVPISYYPRKGRSKLNTMRDGWRHLRFMLLYSPTHLFLAPGLALFLLGLVGELLLLPGPLEIAGRGYEIHAMIAASTLFLIGWQTISLGIFARTFSLTEHFDREDRLLATLYRHFTLERGLIVGTLILAIGLGINLYLLESWIARGFSSLYRAHSALFAASLTVLGVEIIFSSFLLSIFSIRRLRQTPWAKPEACHTGSGMAKPSLGLELIDVDLIDDDGVDRQ